MYCTVSLPGGDTGARVTDGLTSKRLVVVIYTVGLKCPVAVKELLIKD
jgi:hypothetical protein